MFAASGVNHLKMWPHRRPIFLKKYLWQRSKSAVIGWVFGCSVDKAMISHCASLPLFGTLIDFGHCKINCFCLIAVTLWCGQALDH